MLGNCTKEGIVGRDPPRSSSELIMALSSAGKGYVVSLSDPNNIGRDILLGEIPLIT
jgi:hypothetical protein